ncbi:MAG: ribonuclease H family protein [Bacteroidia bacterium]|nr:ribonuclease H family protein [Bacteroidia bacterium]
MTKNKYYVVWKGRKTGIFDNWDECKAQVDEFPDAQHKAFKTLRMAEDAYKGNSQDYIGKEIFESELSQEQLNLIGKPVLESISVDGACDSVSGVAEYQGVDTQSRKRLFYQGPFGDGTNNIVEFLAIVHALAYCKQKNLSLPIYSDSVNAINWVHDKEARTKHSQSKRNEHLFELLERAVRWLKENEYPNKILKWETKAWGENPADFGRK